MSDAKPVNQFTLNVPIRITVYRRDGKYIWEANNGVGSDYVFDSIDEAGKDAKNHFGW